MLAMCAGPRYESRHHEARAKEARMRQAVVADARVKSAHRLKAPALSAGVGTGVLPDSAAAVPKSGKVKVEMSG